MARRCDAPTPVVLTPDTTPAQAFVPEPSARRASVLLAERGALAWHARRRVQDEGGCLILRATAGRHPQVIAALRADNHRRRSRRNQPLTAIHATRPTRQRVARVVAWQVEGHPLRLRLLSSGTHQTQACCSVLTNLPAQRSGLDMLSRASTWRWPGEVLWKAWPSYAPLHACDTAHPASGEGRRWTAIAAAARTRFLASRTPRLAAVPRSTRQVALCAVHG
jgi:hypothetical protein